MLTWLHGTRMTRMMRINTKGLKMEYAEITEKIINAFYKVNNVLGYGFLEKVYENALTKELRGMQLDVKQQYPIKVYYRNEVVGEYFADILVENVVIVELKSAGRLCKEHEFQLINYLRATQVEVGLLLNFGKKAEFRRKVYTKKSSSFKDRTISHQKLS